MIMVGEQDLTAQEAAIYFDIPVTTILCRFAHGLRGDSLLLRVKPKPGSQRKVAAEVRLEVFREIKRAELEPEEIGAKFGLSKKYVQDFMWRVESGH